MKNLTQFYCATLFILTFLGANPLPSDTYQLAEVLPEYPFGYYCNASSIEKLFNQHDIHIVLEVGSWIGGGSTRHFGNLLKPKGGLLYAVDTWLGSTTQQFNQEHYQPILPVVYEQFLSNMIHWGLTETVIPIRMNSITASKTLQVQPDLIYIDGEHTTEAVYADLHAWYPFVKDKGILCGDDWSWPTVRVAVEQFAKEQNLKINAAGNFWLLY